MGRRIEAYVDTGAFIAFLDRSDSHHVRFVRLFAGSPRLLTSALVIAEGHGWFLRRYDRLRAIQFLAFVEALSPLEIVSVGLSEVRLATRWVRQYSDQDLTLTDALGLALMKEHRIHCCWGTDHHLTLAGARLAIHEM